MPGPKRFSDVAVIITCHNYGRFLGTAIRSVLAQTHAPAEILVVDDASDDETRQVAEQFADDGVRYLRVENRNAHLTRKAGVDQTTAEVVLFLDADNALNDDYIEKGLSEFGDRNVAVSTLTCSASAWRPAAPRFQKPSVAPNCFGRTSLTRVR